MVNQPWLFSVLWCAGVSSVTTNACQVLKEMQHPIWLLVSEISIFHKPLCSTRVWVPSCSCQQGGLCPMLCCCGSVTLQRPAGMVGLRGATSTVITAWLIAPLQPSRTYLMIWIVVDCVSFLTILWAFLLLK